jgi:hypothetical protein
VTKVGNNKNTTKRNSSHIVAKVEIVFEDLDGRHEKDGHALDLGALGAPQQQRLERRLQRHAGRAVSAVDAGAHEAKDAPVILGLVVAHEAQQRAHVRGRVLHRRARQTPAALGPQQHARLVRARLWIANLMRLVQNHPQKRAATHD